MVESYTATIQWSGDAALGTVLLAAASRPGCSAKLTESDGIAELEVVVEDSSIQSLRDRVDELMVALSDIEESSK
ncbi:MAG TPA: hypothetical protein D7H99_08120 [Candidatus Poseidoniales archaeon]|nr:hypothetical protein [Euryarchaeota archaeon]DAC25640.1 MAG TPA: hypothetical protein D7H99_08120 [Candidatus Poseidoniales archaeon]HII58918.1 hypothetical protein [Candidatus Poseidoniaceae archaeon]|tara:strand:+ start:1567 stop:1791 length:225 start_codon:yes stop_codon:yes gene_type:complete